MCFFNHNSWACDYREQKKLQKMNIKTAKYQANEYKKNGHQQFVFNRSGGSIANLVELITFMSLVSNSMIVATAQSSHNGTPLNNNYNNLPVNQTFNQSLNNTTTPERVYHNQTIDIVQGTLPIIYVPAKDSMQKTQNKKKINKKEYNLNNQILDENKDLIMNYEHLLQHYNCANSVNLLMDKFRLLFGTTINQRKVALVIDKNTFTKNTYSDVSLSYFIAMKSYNHYIWYHEFNKFTDLYHFPTRQFIYKKNDDHWHVSECDEDNLSYTLSKKTINNEMDDRLRLVFLIGDAITQKDKHSILDAEVNDYYATTVLYGQAYHFYDYILYIEPGRTVKRMFYGDTNIINDCDFKYKMSENNHQIFFNDDSLGNKIMTRENAFMKESLSTLIKDRFSTFLISSEDLEVKERSTTIRHYDIGARFDIY